MRSFLLLCSQSIQTTYPHILLLLLLPKVFLKLHNQLGKLKSNHDAKFDGLNLIVLGDFLQFPAVSHLDLYMNVNPNYSLGHHLWRSLNAVIIRSQ